MLILGLAVFCVAADSVSVVSHKNKTAQYILGGAMIASGITIGTLDLIDASTSQEHWTGTNLKKSWGWDNPTNYHNTIYICISLTAIIAGVAEILH
jgi:hypothetical protein